MSWNRSTDRQAALILTVLCAAAFMASLDLFIVNIAFTAIGHDFHASLADLSWVLNAYAIVYAALLVPLGRMADRYGRKAGFLAGLGLFTAASVACAASSSLWLLVLCRVLQAVGASALTPTSLGLLLTATAPARRARAVRIWAASGAIAAASGPVIGGLLVQASWQWVFLVNLPIGMVALLLAAWTVADSRDTSVSKIPDLLGAAVLAVSVGTLILSLVKGPDWGWASSHTLESLAITVLGLVLFSYRIGHHHTPVIEPALLRVRAFVWANVTALLFSIAFAASLLLIVLWMQDSWHYSALRTGFGVAPGPLMVPIFAAVGQRIAHRVPAGMIAAIGCLLFGLGNLILLLRIGPSPHYATALLPGWLIVGAGVGLTRPTILSAATVDLPANRTATGSAVVTMSFQIGMSLGVSLLIAILGTTSASQNALSTFQHGWWLIIGAAFLGAGAALRMNSPRIQTRPGEVGARLAAATNYRR